MPPALPPTSPQPPWWERPRTRMHQSPGFVLAGTVLLVGGGGAYLAAHGEWLGLTAWVGSNVLSLLMWMVLREPFDRLCRAQSTREALAGWAVAVAVTVGVCWLYRAGYDTIATVGIAVLMIVFLLASWLIASGRMDIERPEGGDGPAK